MVAIKKKKTLATFNRKRKIFYISLIALPVLQFCVFYLGVHINSILLAFKSYTLADEANGVYSYIFTGFENFGEVFQNFAKESYLVNAIWNSVLSFLIGWIGFFGSLLFSYYIMKSWRLGKLFQLFLFLPSIISEIVVVTLFKYFMENNIPAFIEMVGGGVVEGFMFSSDLGVRLGTILGYSVWIGFGTNILIFNGTMAGVSDSVLEAAKLDGVRPLREFFSIVLPMTYPMIVTMAVVSVANLFTNQMYLFSFYGASAERQLYTIGYYLFLNTQQAGNSGLGEYPYLAAFGIVVSAVTIPLTVAFRKVLNKIGKRFE